MKDPKQRIRATLVALLCGLLAVLGSLASADNAKPRLMVIMQEKVMGVFGTTGFEVPTQAETSLMQHFDAQGFAVLDSQTVKRNITQAKGMRLLEGDDVAAAAVGLQHGAQYSVIGSAISKPAGSKLYGTQLQSIHATLTARVIRNDDARVVASGSAAATQAHIDEVQGGAMAIDKAAQQLAQELGEKILAAGDRDLGAGRELRIHISGLVSYRHLDFIMGFLDNEVAGIYEVTLRSFTSGIADLDVTHEEPAPDLARKLANHRFRGFRLEPTHVSSHRMDLRCILER